MASITENKKNGKIVSFKFRVFIGRDDEGKQQFKTKIWKPDQEYPTKTLKKLAQMEAALWEHSIVQGVTSEPEEESIRNWEIIMEYKISNLDFTMKSEDDFYDTVDMGDFRDADLIYEHLHNKMRIIL
jgi:hypothetical protein